MSNTIKYTEIDETMFNELFHKNAPVFYKGIRSEYLNFSFASIDTQKFVRPSKTVKQTYHFYDLSFNNCSSWKEMPQRSKSIIGTTSIQTARTYGNSLYECYLISGDAYRCPANDIHFSFSSKLIKSLQQPDNHSILLQFNKEVVYVLKKAGWDEFSIRECDYSDLISFLGSDIFKGFIEKPPILKWLGSCHDPENGISELFNPSANGFKKYNITSIDILNGDSEVFASGLVILKKI